MITELEATLSTITRELHEAHLEHLPSMRNHLLSLAGRLGLAASEPTEKPGTQDFLEMSAAVSACLFYLVQLEYVAQMGVGVQESWGFQVNAVKVRTMFDEAGFEPPASLSCAGDRPLEYESLKDSASPPSESGPSEQSKPRLTVADDLIHFEPMTAGQLGTLISTAHEVAHQLETEKSQRATAEFARESEAVEKYVRDHGQVIVEQNLLEEAFEASSEILERMPWVEDEDGTLITNTVEVFAKLRLMLRAVKKEDDFDLSDNEPGADSAQVAENTATPASIRDNEVSVQSTPMAENSSKLHEVGAA